MAFTIRISLTLLLAIMASSASLQAADFGFSSVIKAGQSNNGDWELGIGPTGNNAANTSHVVPYYSNNTDRRFEIGFTSATRTAYLRYYQANGTYTTVTYTTPYAFSPTATVRWEIPATGFYLQADSRNRPTGIYLSQLQLTGAGLNILQPLGVTNVNATQLNTNVSTNIGTPLSFRTTGGDWMLSGNIRFQGLSEYVSGGARRSELRMGFSAGGFVESPEPTPMALTASGLLALVFVEIRRRNAAA